MKKSNLIFLAATIFLAQACNNGPKDSVDAAKDANASKDSSTTTATTTTTPAMDSTTNTTTMKHDTGTVSKDASDFAVEAANGGMMEVELGKYVEQNGASARVKNFGAMMVKDHTKAGDELKAIASKKNITLPQSVGDKQKKMMTDLMKKTGKDLDDSYMKMMLDDHKEDIKEFQKAADKNPDVELKSFATKTLPTLNIHLDSAKAITGKH